MKNGKISKSSSYTLKLLVKEFIIVVVISLLTFIIQKKFWPVEVNVKVEKGVETECIDVTICNENDATSTKASD